MQQFAHQFKAMGTTVGLWLWHADKAAAQTALAHTEQFFTQTEVQLSRFLPASELSRLNQSAGKPFHASALLFNLTRSALAWRQKTGGIFDPTILHALVAQGYNRSFEQINGQSNNTPPVKHQPGRIKLSRARRNITLNKGAGLDLGGIAKGWAVQQAARQLGQYGPALVDVGGDIACTDPPPGQSFWAVNIADPYQAEQDIATLFLANQAVATSTQTGRRWIHNGQPAHHLIDPRAGQSAQSDLAGVTVIAPRLPNAEIHAKTALILGRAQGLAYLARQAHLAGLLVTTNHLQLTFGNIEEKAYVYSRPIHQTPLHLD